MSNTMAEAFCEEYLITWTEHGEDFTGWRQGDIVTGSQQMSEAGAISLFHPLQEDHLLVVTVFRDRSWIVQQEPTNGAPPRSEPERTNAASRTSSTGRWRPGWTSWFTGTDQKSPTQNSPPTAPTECPNGPGWSPLFPQRPKSFFTPPAGAY